MEKSMEQRKDVMIDLACITLASRTTVCPRKYLHLHQHKHCSCQSLLELKECWKKALLERAGEINESK